MEIIPDIESLKLINIDDDTYFSSEYSKYVSNSRLSKINPEQGGSEELFFKNEKLEFTDSLFFGSAIHQLILQPEDFFVVDLIDRPTSKAGLMADELYKKTGKAPTDSEIIMASNKIGYYRDKMNDKKIDELRSKCNNYWRSRAIFENSYKESKIPIYLDCKSREKVNRCVSSLNNNSNIQSLLHPIGIVDTPISLNEQTILIDLKIKDNDKECILKIKAKLDNFTIDKESNLVVLNDLKTTGHYTTDFKDSFYKYHYYRQMGLYSWLLLLVAKKYYNVESATLNSNMLLVSTVPEYFSDVYVVDKANLLKGFNEFKELIKLVAKGILYDGYEL